MKQRNPIYLIPAPEYSHSNRRLTPILITPEKFGCNRETVRPALEAENIESRPVWKPMHLQPVFRGGEERRKRRYEARAVGGEVAEALFTRGLCLPSGTAMTEEDLNKITSIIREVSGEARKRGS